MSDAVLKVENLSKSFGGTYAIQDVSFQVAAGEVLCLLGDNGAGKSTLIKTLSGVHSPDGGRIWMGGKPVGLDSPRGARDLGIATVHQDAGAIPLMSVSRNFFLGNEIQIGRGPFRRIDQKASDDIALAQLRAMGITRIEDAGQLCGVMSGGERQALAIARAIYFGGKVLILDEPTAALGVKESEIVLRQIDQARARGVAVILITHNIHHAEVIGDHFVVLVRGRVADDFRAGQRSRDQMLDLMSGGERFQAFARAVGS